ncbi:restriction endonuclease subunit M [Aeromonas veronii]|nr:restriction endonuclease subunit M [Aeromonas veronii]
MTTADNERFVRYWYELNFSFFSHPENPGGNWYPYNKGGEYKKWYGNRYWAVLWGETGEQIKSTGRASVRSEELYLTEMIGWTDITSYSQLGVRYYGEGFIFDASGPSVFPTLNCTHQLLLGYMGSKMSSLILNAVNPTLHVQAGNISSLPWIDLEKTSEKKVHRCVSSLIENAKNDWNSYETSWDFSGFPLLHLDYPQSSLKARYQKLCSHWHETILEMQRLEEENNRLFIEAYGLQDELTPEVPLSEITLTCNPHYRYGGNLSDEEREARLQSDTIAELISYTIGCMMGRYSLDREGLVYAHAGNEGFKALMEEGAYATFAADEDGILPLSTDSWFEDDVATRLEAFVCTVWGKETLEENLQFIADSLCLAAIKLVKKGGETARETLRRYLSTQFYKDHLKTYKKRPIYWLFSSGKEKAFECLVYLHRYNEATLPRMRTEYVTPLLGQMAGRIDRLRLQQAEASTAEAKRLGKEIDSLTKQLTELRAFDDELKHHADMRITLDLDDGVKVNYGKFGTLLSDVKAITGDKGE